MNDFPYGVRAQYFIKGKDTPILEIPIKTNMRLDEIMSRIHFVYYQNGGQTAPVIVGYYKIILDAYLAAPIWHGFE